MAAGCGFGCTEDVLRTMAGKIALVGNGTPPEPFGGLIDRYDNVIRMNNYVTHGFEGLVGTKTDFRCTSGWHDIKVKGGEMTEFSPFTEGSRESIHLGEYRAKRGKPVLAARTDIHPLVPETPNPSTGLSMVQLAASLGIDVDLFCFDGFRKPHYWSGTISATTHSQDELGILLSRPTAFFVGETYPYAQTYDYCFGHHAAYHENVGLNLFNALGLSVSSRDVVEFGAGTGELSQQLERSGNSVTAVEVSRVAYDRIACSRKICGGTTALLRMEGAHDLFVSVDVLEHLTESDVRLVLREAARLCRSLFVCVSTRPSGLLGPNGENLHLTVRPDTWWLDTTRRWFGAWSRPGSFPQQTIIEGDRL